MSPAGLQSARMIDTRSQFLPKPFLPSAQPATKAGPVILSVKPRKEGALAVRFSVYSPPPPPLTDGGGLGGGGEGIGVLERPYRGPSSSGWGDYGPVMKGDHGAFGAVTLERGKLDMSKKEAKTSPEVATGGGSGDNGRKINSGGGDGGDDDGDDDNYFDDFDDGDEGDDGGLFRTRMLLKELFDRKFLDAILKEWHKTMMDLPAGFRQACEMGLVSSAQLVKFLAMNARPTTARFISRLLPDAMSRAFIGRMTADPAFLYKLLLEQAATIGFAFSWELKNRKNRIKEEWDLALLNVFAASLCNAAVVWTLAPCRSYGDTFRFNLQNTLQKLPNNMFERSYPLRAFDLQKRLHSLCYKAAELCLVGVTAGAVQGSLSNFLAGKKKDRLAVTIPSVSSNALAYGAFLGIYSNLSYQLLYGADKLMTNHFDVIGVSLFLGTALRIMNVNFGDTLRHAWLGMEADPLVVHSDDLLKAYSRPSTSSGSTSPKWFISKNSIISGLFGSRQRTTDSTNGEAAPPKARRKRIVRKKVTAS